MVDHTVASRTNIERLRQVYHQLYKYRDLSMDLDCLLFGYLCACNILIFLIFHSL